MVIDKNIEIGTVSCRHSSSMFTGNTIRGTCTSTRSQRHGGEITSATGVNGVKCSVCLCTVSLTPSLPLSLLSECWYSSLRPPVCRDEHGDFLHGINRELRRIIIHVAKRLPQLVWGLRRDRERGHCNSGNCCTTPHTLHDTLHSFVPLSGFALFWLTYSPAPPPFTSHTATSSVPTISTR